MLPTVRLFLFSALFLSFSAPMISQEMEALEDETISWFVQQVDDPAIQGGGVGMYIDPVRVRQMMLLPGKPGESGRSAMKLVFTIPVTDCIEKLRGKEAPLSVSCIIGGKIKKRFLIKDPRTAEQDAIYFFLSDDLEEEPFFKDMIKAEGITVYFDAHDDCQASEGTFSLRGFAEAYREIKRNL